VLPYRNSDGLPACRTSPLHGLPTVVTRVGNFPETVRDGVDGLICAPATWPTWCVPSAFSTSPGDWNRSGGRPTRRVRGHLAALPGHTPRAGRALQQRR